MAHYRVLAWRDIPVGVKATDPDGTTVSRQLPAEFQQRIDREAMRLGLVDTDSYLEAWAWSEPQERSGGAQEVADQVYQELIERHA